MADGHIHRRTFLKALGAGLAASATVPLLESLGTAAPEEYPTRIIFFFSANGTIPGRWRPNGGEDDWTIPDNGILRPLRSFRDRLLVVEGVDMLSARNGPGDGHQTGMGHMLTGTELLEGPFEGGNGGSAGYSSGISVDQYIANQVHDGETFKSLEFGVQCGGPNNWSRMSYAGRNQPVEPSQNPYNAFDRIFGSVSQDAAQAERIRQRRLSVLDFVREDLRQVEKRASAADRQRLENHLTAIRELERQLMVGNEQGIACMEPDTGQRFDPSRHANYQATGRLMIDLMVAALACGQTRVASIQWSKSVSNITLPWAGVGNDRHHKLSHEGDNNTDAVEKLVKINHWYAEQFAYLLQALDDVQEGEDGETLLDHTVVVWCNELGKGNSHTRNDVPYVLAGGANGFFRTGRYLQYDRDPHNNMLVSLCNAMGVQTDTFGNPAYCTGPLQGLT